MATAYITFVDPTSENGVHVFARIADALGRLRPDIPLLVIEGVGTEEARGPRASAPAAPARPWPREHQRAQLGLVSNFGERDASGGDDKGMGRWAGVGRQ